MPSKEPNVSDDPKYTASQAKSESMREQAWAEIRPYEGELVAVLLKVEIGLRLNDRETHLCAAALSLVLGDLAFNRANAEVG